MATVPPFLLAGLGNPGPSYRQNRHNVGFMLLDRLAGELNASFGKVQHRALVTDARLGDHKLILAKPQTMMNRVGDSIGALVRYYQIPLAQLLVAYDDLDLPPGSLRLRPAGGSGGHKGVRSILQAVGSQSFPRLRIGIGRPPGRMDPADYVLEDFSDVEREALEITLDQAVNCVRVMILEDLDRAMTECNEG